VSPSRGETACVLAAKTSVKEGDIPKIEGCMPVLDNASFYCYLLL
jgi:hypothetical protein